MGNTRIVIELNDMQQAQYEDWCATIKKLYGKIGNMTWSVSDCGIGETIKVYNDLTKLTLDLTDIDSW
jgi:hypothetical protein